MMLDKLGISLRNSLSKIASSIFVDETLINAIIKDIQKALLSADVNVKLVFELSSKLKNRMLSQRDAPGLSQKDRVLTILYEELVSFLGAEPKEEVFRKRPTYVMLLGLFGSGKTTTAGKLSRHYKKRGYKTAVIQTDTWRPAALEQLKQLASQTGVDCYGGGEDPIRIFEENKEMLEKYDVVIVDTAGRDALNEELIEELTKLSQAVNPEEKYLVMSADLGQAASKQTQTFHDTCAITGVIITKMDGTAKGGGALSACAITNSPVVYVGVGEKIDDLEKFDPKRFVSRLLGMGDIQTLLEKAKEAMPEEKAQDMSKRFMGGKFNLIDLYEQMLSLKKMGGIRKIVEMIPGLSNAAMPKEMLNVQEDQLKHWKYIMDSMTQEELMSPEVLSGSRIERISSGSGTKITDVKGLIKKYAQSKKMMKMFRGRNINKMKKMLGGQLPV